MEEVDSMDYHFQHSPEQLNQPPITSISPVYRISNYHSIELAPFAPKTGVGIEDIQNETIDIVISQKRT